MLTCPRYAAAGAGSRSQGERVIRGKCDYNPRRVLRGFAFLCYNPLIQTSSGEISMKFAGWYCVVVGFLMLAQWGFFLIAGQVPEMQTAPIALAFHLAAEAATALALIV